MTGLLAGTALLRENRHVARNPVVIPAIMQTGDQAFTVRVLDITSAGAMIGAEVSVPDGASVLLRCGSVQVRAVVVWCSAERLGLRFLDSADHSHIELAIRRSEALAKRLSLKRQTRLGLVPATN